GPVVQDIHNSDQKQQSIQPVKHPDRETSMAAPMDNTDNGGSNNYADQQDRTNRPEDFGNILLPSLVSRPLFRDVDVASCVDNFISRNLDCESRLPFGQAVILSVFEYKCPIGPRRLLAGVG